MQAIILQSSVVVPRLIVRANLARFTTPKSLATEKVSRGSAKTMARGRERKARRERGSKSNVIEEREGSENGQRRKRQKMHALT